MNRDNVSLWYFMGFNKNGDVLHVDHDVFASGERGRDQARKEGDSMFRHGKFIEGQHVEFDRIVAISEDHEIALDIRRGGVH